MLVTKLEDHGTMDQQKGVQYGKRSTLPSVTDELVISLQDK